LSHMNRPGVFPGTSDELRQIFHSGQGCHANPLSPIVMPVPAVPLSALVPFTICHVGHQRGGLTAADEAKLAEYVEQILHELQHASRLSVLLPVTTRVVAVWRRTSQVDVKDHVAAAQEILERTETLGGLGESPLGGRSRAVQQKLIHGLAGESLDRFLKSRLVGQDTAIETLTRHIRTEFLTRASHQPIRAGLVGTSGTGKSTAAALLAEHFGMPLMRVDLASMTEAHTFSAQMLGSGRGIVGSYQAGRLETAAKDHRGVVLELSDIDHVTNPNVRSAIADLFLDVMDTGEAQSAKGARFACSNVILIFTANYGRSDDEMTRNIGYVEFENDGVAARGRREIKTMFSSAFLDRLGHPIFFHPLPRESWALIAERAVSDAVHRAGNNLSWPIENVTVAPDVGSRVVAWMDAAGKCIGARTVQEHARMLAAEAIHRFGASYPAPVDKVVVHVALDVNRSLKITFNPQES